MIFCNLSPASRSTCHRHSSEKHLGQHVPECISALPGGGRPPEHDVHLAEGWRERLPRGVSAFISSLFPRGSRLPFTWEQCYHVTFILDGICSDASEIGAHSKVNYVSFTLYFEVIIIIIFFFLYRPHWHKSFCHFSSCFYWIDLCAGRFMSAWSGAPSDIIGLQIKMKGFIYKKNPGYSCGSNEPPWIEAELNSHPDSLIFYFFLWHHAHTCG